MNCQRKEDTHPSPSPVRLLWQGKWELAVCVPDTSGRAVGERTDTVLDFLERFLPVKGYAPSTKKFTYWSHQNQTFACSFSTSIQSLEVQRLHCQPHVHILFFGIIQFTATANLLDKISLWRENSQEYLRLFRRIQNLNKCFLCCIALHVNRDIQEKLWRFHPMVV